MSARSGLKKTPLKEKTELDRAERNQAELDNSSALAFAKLQPLVEKPAPEKKKSKAAEIHDQNQSLRMSVTVSLSRFHLPLSKWM